MDRLEDMHDDDVVLDFLESEFKFLRPDVIELYDGASGRTTRGRYCHVQQIDDIGEYKVELNDITIRTTKSVAEKLLHHITAFKPAEPSDLEEFYCSALNGADLAEDIRDEYWCYPAKGCDVTFYWYDENEDSYCELKGINESSPESEVLVLTTHKGEISYLRKDVTVFSCSSKFFIGYAFQATEISKDLYEVLKSSNRATATTIEDTDTFGKIESFCLYGPPTRKDMRPTSNMEDDDDTSKIIDF